MFSHVRRLAAIWGWLLLLGAAAAQAQLTVTSISANPSAPESGDNVLFTVTVQAPGSCFTDPTQTMDGNIQESAVPLVLPACQDTGLPNDTSFTFQAQVGVFWWTGTYTVQVFRNTDYPLGNPVGTMSLPVIPYSDGSDGGYNGNGYGQGLCGPDPCYRQNTNACASVAPPSNAKPEPCNLMLDLTSAITGLPTSSTGGRWTTYLDTNFERWTYNGLVVGSQNEPVMSAAIALWESPYGTSPQVIDPSTGQAFNAYQWWYTFLNCQNGGYAGPNCIASSSNTLQYLNGAEIVSSTYGAYVALSVASVALWAQKHPTLDTQNIAAAAGHYLQMTMGIWALGAGPTWAKTQVYYHPPNTAPASYSCDSTSLQVPFLALAGARSVIDDACHDDRGPIFATAIGYKIGTCNQETYMNRLEEAIQCAWVPNSTGNNVFGVSPTNAPRLQGFIGVPNMPVGEGDLGTATTIIKVLKGARFIQQYDILGWTGERASVLAANPDTNTTPIYAIVYNTAALTSESLDPWTVDRMGATIGYGELVGPAGAPTGAQASDCYSDGNGCSAFNPFETQQMTFFPNMPYPKLNYHVVLTPTADAAMK